MKVHKPTLVAGVALGALGIGAMFGLTRMDADGQATMAKNPREGHADEDLYGTVAELDEVPPEVLAEAIDVFGGGVRDKVRALSCSLVGRFLECWDGEKLSDDGNAVVFQVDPVPWQLVLDSHRDGLSILRLAYNHLGGHDPKHPTSVNIVGRYRDPGLARAPAESPK